jgi:hypothetical protein
MKSLGTLQVTLSKPRVNKAPKLGDPLRDEGLDADSQSNLEHDRSLFKVGPDELFNIQSVQCWSHEAPACAH